MNWNAYVIRRKIDVPTWLKVRGITNREQFINHLRSIAVDPPEDVEILKMFPTQQAVASKENDDTQPAAPEGRDQTATRSMAGEGNVSGVRSSRKSDSKFRA